ncbi:MAG: hypothetical protein ABIG92_03565 [Candidatus Omnitrophota bacterium]
MRRYKRGSVLILALWSLILLTSFTVTISYSMRQKLIVIKRLEERQDLRSIAESGIKKAIYKLRKSFGEEEKTYQALSDSWSKNEDSFKNIKIGDMGIVDVSYEYLDEAGLTNTVYGMVDEERKVNINKVNDGKILEKLFVNVFDLDEYEAEDLAAALIDWRDSDNASLSAGGSTESSYYRNLKFPYEAKDSEYQIMDEVSLVKGVTEDIFKRIGDYITIYGDGKININTTSKEVLLALGLSESFAETILLYRDGEDGIPGTGDDMIFDAADTIVSKISQFDSGMGGDILRLTALVDQGFLSTTSNNFKIRAVAGLLNSNIRMETVCFVDKDGVILQWREQ